MIQKLRKISYEMRLKECGLTTIETRRFLKYWMGMKILTEFFFTVKEERRSTGHGVTLAKNQCRLDIRQFSFSQRTVNESNRLSAELLVVLIYLKIKSTCT